MHRATPENMKKAALRQRESAEQRKLFRWIRANAKRLPGVDYAFATLNGAMLHGDRAARARTWNRLQAEGAKKGVSDIFIPVPRSGMHGLWIEMKAAYPYAAAATKEQRKWIELMHLQGYEAFVCRGFDQAVAVIEEYFGRGDQALGAAHG